MKIKVTEKPYSEVIKIEKRTHIKPVKQSKAWRLLMKQLSQSELKDINFTYTEVDMEKLHKDQPALFLMNHSSFTDLQIASKLLFDRQFHIIMTNDGMVGKAGLMYRIGCIPTKKFITDPTLVRDMKYTFDKLNSSILMYPEASYSFDGTTTPLPDSIGKCIKLCGVPVVMIRTTGAFLRDPLYNNLQKRKVDVSAKVTYLLSKDDIKTKTAAEISTIVNKAFEYDHFAEQLANDVLITEDFRADGLERALYKCSCCGDELHMKGKGTTIVCESCGDTHELAENGSLVHVDIPEAEKTAPVLERLHAPFDSIPAWYAWERSCVLEEIKKDTYSLELDVDILMLVDFESMYKVGSGHLSHNKDGFHLTGCDGELDYTQTCKSSYSLYADYFWYEIGDMISIGDTNAQYYCFPTVAENIPVAKARIATEELYKIAVSTDL